MTGSRTPDLCELLVSQVAADNALPPQQLLPLSPSHSDDTIAGDPLGTTDDGHLEFNSYDSSTTMNIDLFSNQDTRQHFPRQWNAEQSVTSAALPHYPDANSEARLKQAMADGRPFHDSHPGLVRARERCRNACQNYNSYCHDENIRQTALLLVLDQEDTTHNVRISPPFICNYGYNLRLGPNFDAGEGFNVDDSAAVSVENDVRIGKHCSLKTSCRVDGSSTFYGPTTAHPIEIHEKCTIEDHVDIRGGTSIGKRCKIMSGTKIGRGITIEQRCSIGIGCIIEDDVYIQEGCKIEPNVIIRKGATLCRNCSIGVGCVIERDAHIGASCQIGSATKLGQEVTIGMRCGIEPGCLIGQRARIKCCTVRLGAIIGDAAFIDERAVLESGCVIGRRARLGMKCHIGAGVTVRNNARLEPLDCL